MIRPFTSSLSMWNTVTPIFNSRFRCYALYALYDDAFGFLVGCQFGFIHDFIDVACRVGLGFVFRDSTKRSACFVGTQPADGFQFFAFFGFQFLQLFFATRQSLLLVFQPFTVGFYFSLFAVQGRPDVGSGSVRVVSGGFRAAVFVGCVAALPFPVPTSCSGTFLSLRAVFFSFDDFGFFARFFR